MWKQVAEGVLIIAIVVVLSQCVGCASKPINPDRPQDRCQPDYDKVPGSIVWECK